VRDLNEGARRDNVQDLVRDTGSTIVCLQETKLSMVDHHVITHTLGSKFIINYAARPTNQTRGGILLAVLEDFFMLSNISTFDNAITTMITMKANDTEWWITVVYGPQSDANKLLFLQELWALASKGHERWLVLGDFNLIYQSSDNNNLNLNRCLMGSFKSPIDDIHLKELRLNGRQFT
jgi:exonuclease III